MKTILTLAILSSLAAAPVMAKSFTRDGVSYTYTTKTVGEYLVISGSDLTSGKAFHLRVKGTKVSGRFGDSPVQFRIAPTEVAANAGGTVLAAK